MPRLSKPRWFKPRECWRYRLAGRSYYAPRTIAKSDEAGAWRWAHTLMHGSSTPGVDFELTVEEVRQLYLQAMVRKLANKKVAKGTYVIQQRHTRYFCELNNHGDLPATRLDVLHLERFRVWLEGNEYAPATTQLAIRNVSAMLNWAAKPDPERKVARLISTNPFAGYSYNLVHEKKPYRAVAELRRFLRLIAGATRGRIVYRVSTRNLLLLLRVARLTGCRPGELCGALWTDLDEGMTRIVLPADRHKTGYATGQPRIIFLPETCRRIFHYLRRKNAADGNEFSHIFNRENGPWCSGYISNRLASWRNSLRQAGLRKITAYDLRRTYCTDALANGASYANVAKLVGNNPATLAKYYDLPAIERLAQEAADINNRLREAEAIKKLPPRNRAM